MSSSVNDDSVLHTMPASIAAAPWALAKAREVPDSSYARGDIVEQVDARLSLAIQELHAFPAHSQVQDQATRSDAPAVTQIHGEVAFLRTERKRIQQRWPPVHSATEAKTQEKITSIRGRRRTLASPTWTCRRKLSIAVQVFEVEASLERVKPKKPSKVRDAGQRLMTLKLL